MGTEDPAAEYVGAAETPAAAAAISQRQT